MALFNILMGPLNAFPWVINGLMEAWVSVKRVHSFITIPNLDLNRYYTTSAGTPVRWTFKHVYLV